MPQDRLTPEHALGLLDKAPLLDVMLRADAARRDRFPGGEVTFVIDTNPNYTNACVTACTFCSFYRKPGDPEAYLLAPAAVAEKVRRAAERGATTVLLQGGHHPDLALDYYLDIIAAIRKAAPSVHLHLFSPPEVAHIAEVNGIAEDYVLDALWDAGQRTMPGGGAEILVDEVRRKISPKKLGSDGWLRIMRKAHQRGMKTSATMTYGHVETSAHIVEHLRRLRALQDETGGFYAFIPWSFKAGDSPLGRLVPEPALPSRYARIIALARLFLDNVPHIQASWFSEGWRAGQLALHAGADDFGGVLIEENVLREAGHALASTVDSVAGIIRDAGFSPVQRTTLYECVRSHEDGGSNIDQMPVSLRVREEDGAISLPIGAAR